MNVIGKKICAAVNERLKAQGIKIDNRRIVDATIITTSSSTNNNEKEFNAEMHQPKKAINRILALRAISEWVAKQISSVQSMLRQPICTIASNTPHYSIDCNDSPE